MPDIAATPDQVKQLWESNAETWTRLSRAGYDVYRDALNTPAFLALLPPVDGLSGLDIGCGEGSNTRLVAQMGARMTALDISPTFLGHARATEAESPLGIEYREGDAMALPFGTGTFDFATAFMCLMDVPYPELAVQEAFRILKPGGFFQCSLLHPCFCPPSRKVIRVDGQVRGVEITDYFSRIDGRVDVWTFGALPKDQRAGVAPFQVPRFHRTLSEWVSIVTEAGFVIGKMAEPSATDEVVRAYPEMDDTQKVGIFLHFQLLKPKS